MLLIYIPINRFPKVAESNLYINLINVVDGKNDELFYDYDDNTQVCNLAIEISNPQDIQFFQNTKQLHDTLGDPGPALGFTVVYLYAPETTEFANSYYTRIYKVIKNNSTTYAVISPDPEHCTIVPPSSTPFSYFERTNVFDLDTQTWSEVEDHRRFRFSYDLNTQTYTQVYVCDKESGVGKYYLPLEGDSPEDPCRCMTTFGPYPEGAVKNLKSVDELVTKLENRVTQLFNKALYDLVRDCFKLNETVMISDYTLNTLAYCIPSDHLKNHSGKISFSVTQSTILATYQTIFLNMVSSHDGAELMIPKLMILHGLRAVKAMTLISIYKNLYHEILQIYLNYRALILTRYNDKTTTYKTWYEYYIYDKNIFGDVVGKLDELKRTKLDTATDPT